MKKYILLTLFSLNLMQIDSHAMDCKENIEVNNSSKKESISMDISEKNINKEQANSAIGYWEAEVDKYKELMVINCIFDFSYFFQSFVMENPAENNDSIVYMFIKNAAQEIIKSDEYGYENEELFNLVENLHPFFNYYKHKSVLSFWKNEESKHKSLKIIGDEFDFEDFSKSLIRREPLLHNEIIVSRFILSAYKEIINSGEYDLSNEEVVDFFGDIDKLYKDYVLKGNS